MWILTSEYNDYDQHGAYFEAAFDVKPTFKELKAILQDTDAVVGKVLRGVPAPEAYSKFADLPCEYKLFEYNGKVL